MTTNEEETMETDRHTDVNETERRGATDVVDLLAAQPPKQPDVVTGLLRSAELAVVGALREADGETLALGLGLARACGIPWLAADTRLGPTLVVSATDVRHRLRGLQAGLALGPDRRRAPERGRLSVLTSRALRLDSPEGRAALERALDEAAADLVILHGAGRLCVETVNLLAVLDQLVERRGLTAVVTCHLRADWARRLRQAADVLLALEPEAGAASTLTLERRGPEPPLELLVRKVDGWFKPVPRARVAPEARSAAHAAPHPPATAG